MTINTHDYKVGLASMQFFNKDSQYISIKPLTTGNIGLSFLFWVKFNSYAKYSHVIDFGNGAYNDSIVVGMLNNGVNYGLYCFIDGNPNTFLTIITLHEWYHFAWIINPDGSWSWYSNGVLFFSQSGTLYPRSIQRYNNYLGKSNWMADPYFNGLIDDFRMYNFAVSQSLINTAYNAQALTAGIITQH